MIIVAGTFTVPPEQHDAMVGAIAGLSAATRAEEGCLDYDFWADLAQRGRFHVFEVWASEADLAAHSAAPHLGRFPRGPGPPAGPGHPADATRPGDCARSERAPGDRGGAPGSPRGLLPARPIPKRPERRGGLGLRACGPSMKRPPRATRAPRPTATQGKIVPKRSISILPSVGIVLGVGDRLVGRLVDHVEDLDLAAGPAAGSGPHPWCSR